MYSATLWANYRDGSGQGVVFLFFLSFVPFFLSFDPFSLDLFLIPEKVLFIKNLPPPPQAEILYRPWL